MAEQERSRAERLAEQLREFGGETDAMWIPSIVNHLLSEGHHPKNQ